MSVHHSWGHGREVGSRFQVITPAMVKKENPETKQNKTKNPRRWEHRRGAFTTNISIITAWEGNRCWLQLHSSSGGKEIELKDRISDVTEMIPRCLLRAALGTGTGGRGNKRKIWVCFLETCRRCDYSEGVDEAGRVAVRCLSGEDKAPLFLLHVCLTTSAASRGLHSRLLMLISQTKPSHTYMQRNNGEERAELRPVFECRLMCLNGLGVLTWMELERTNWFD